VITLERRNNHCLPSQVSGPRQQRPPALFPQSITLQVPAGSWEAGHSEGPWGPDGRELVQNRVLIAEYNLTTSGLPTLSSSSKMGTFFSVLLNPLSESTGFICDGRENSKSALSPSPILCGATESLSTFLCKHHQSDSSELSHPADPGRQFVAVTTGLLKMGVPKGEMSLFHFPSAIKELMQLWL